MVTTTITASPTLLGTSYYGNPYYTLHTEDGDYRTSIDSGCNYAASNYRPGATVELFLTRAGRVYDIRGCTPL